MYIQKWIKEILLSAVVMMVLDFTYISFLYKPFSDQIVNIQRVVMQFRPIGAVVCYIALITGLYYFILRTKREPLEAFLLGLIIYAVYESTNYATLKKWTPMIACIDTLWGGVLFGSTTYLTYKLVDMI